MPHHRITLQGDRRGSSSKGVTISRGAFVTIYKDSTAMDKKVIEVEVEVTPDDRVILTVWNKSVFKRVVHDDKDASKIELIFN